MGILQELLLERFIQKKKTQSFDKLSIEAKSSSTPCCTAFSVMPACRQGQTRLTAPVGYSACRGIEIAAFGAFEKEHVFVLAGEIRALKSLPISFPGCDLNLYLALLSVQD